MQPRAWGGGPHTHSRTGRHLRVDSNERHRGSVAGDGPLLLELEAAAGDGDGVIGRKQGDGPTPVLEAGGLASGSKLERTYADGIDYNGWR
jgi:hypothetical protein